MDARCRPCEPFRLSPYSACLRIRLVSVFALSSVAAPPLVRTSAVLTEHSHAWMYILPTHAQCQLLAQEKDAADAAQRSGGGGRARAGGSPTAAARSSGNGGVGSPRVQEAPSDAAVSEVVQFTKVRVRVDKILKHVSVN